MNVYKHMLLFPYAVISKISHPSALLQGEENAKVIYLKSKHCKILNLVFLYHSISNVALFTAQTSSNKGDVDYIILSPCKMLLNVLLCRFGLHLLYSCMTCVILFNIVLYINTMDAVLTVM